MHFDIQQRHTVDRLTGGRPFCVGWACCLLLVSVSLGGCRTPMQDGPVSKSLATCRQYSQQGKSAIERGDWAEAEALLARAIESCPVDAEARKHYAEALIRRGSYGEAGEQLDEAIRLAPDDVALWVRAAEVQLELGNVALAHRRAERSLELDARQDRVWLVLGHIRRQEGDLNQALAAYHRALGYRPDSSDVLLAMAQLYRQRNEPHRALSCLHALVDAHPANEVPADSWFLLGQTYRALDRYDDAIVSLTTARQQGAPFTETSLLLAECQLAAGQAAAARQTTIEALALQPQHAQARALLERIELARHASPPMVQR